MILYIICGFTFLIHFTESLAYCLRLAGIRTRQVAIALSFVTSTLLISRLSNMFQAPLLGATVDNAIASGSAAAITQLTSDFRLVIFSGFLGAFVGMVATPTAMKVFESAIKRFQENGSLVRTTLYLLNPVKVIKNIFEIKGPKLSMFKSLSLKNIPKQFLILNIFITAIYSIGVLCSLLAGAYLPELRSTAIQLSGIVNGIATILLTLFVDPAGARITDQAYNGDRPENNVRSVVFFLQAGKLVGTLIIAQLLLSPFTTYIMAVTKWLAFHSVGL